ncbi:MAG: hypothetical protein AMJ54_00195 [Deltaproteobacteria bacterium SG8_13]|nr:MAG: hypothetical protein AMJ54_00195 [Deltaproteobacteria bacterium SG8_13]
MIVLLVLPVFWVLPAGAAAPVFIQDEGVFLYFPETEQGLGSALMKGVPEIRSFLQARGLPVPTPLHIILDDERDEPDMQAYTIPHLEIRIPLRAPGVLEDGYTEADPWHYYLFKGLCLQGIYAIRGGVPGFLYRGFGELISPNVILPPWVEDGICSFLYAQYRQTDILGPFEQAVFGAIPTPDLELISHHPQIWPGYHAYRIFGRPFFAWLDREYGWDKILEFLQVHGRGIVPIEIDLKALQVFGKTGAGLWRDFQRTRTRRGQSPPGLLITGYWSEPFVYWNRSGVFPGKLQVRSRGRYGYVEPGGTIWLSEYNDSSRIYRYSAGTTTFKRLRHVWDPGPGRVAVTRRGRRPALIIFPDDGRGGFRLADQQKKKPATLIEAPPGVIQLSGPVRDDNGRIAVAGNRDGNWDIWVYDNRWYRLTTAPSVQMDPWWEGESLVYASNETGRFQIHAGGEQLSRSTTAAILPRQGKYMDLTPSGWKLMNYKIDRAGFAPFALPASAAPQTAEAAPPPLGTRPYSPFKSLWPNYIRPDFFAAVTDLQIGLATRSRDVTGDYKFDAGLRYSFDANFFAFRAGLQFKEFGTQYTRYPLSYTTALDQTIDEARNEIRLFWRPVEQKLVEATDILRAREGFDLIDGAEISLNGRTFRPLEGSGASDEEAWIGVDFARRFAMLRTWGSLELFTENRQSFSFGANLLFGDQILASINLLAGRSWGEPTAGHTTFRVGGSVGEGYFTRRPTRLFPIRGFDSELLEAPKAATGNVEVFWPLANLQYGYATLPLYLHRLRLGTFVDAGFAAENPTSDDLLVGAGFELVTSLEFAWGNFSAFRAGVAWPLVQPDFLDQKGPQFVFQLGRPL